MLAAAAMSRAGGVNPCENEVVLLHGIVGVRLASLRCSDA